MLLARPTLAYVDASELFNHEGFNWNALATDLDSDGRADMLFTQDGHATQRARCIKPRWARPRALHDRAVAG